MSDKRIQQQVRPRDYWKWKLAKAFVIAAFLFVAGVAVWDKFL